MRIGALLLGFALYALGLGACGMLHTDSDRTQVDVPCKANQPCTVHVTVSVKSSGVIFPIPRSCKVDFPDATYTKAGPGTEVSWTLPSVSTGHLEFVGNPGIDLVGPAPDFIDRGYGDGGTDRGTYVWAGNTKRDMKERTYTFQVVWVNAFTENPIPCGVVDPIIVNSL